ncbi:MAG: hypothetical protein E7376_00665 [Clostridiales bacterium]|nr:hypothetical protein [Clostridiales bacterium]
MTFSETEVRGIFKHAHSYFYKAFPGGVTLQEVVSLEQNALKRYLKLCSKNIKDDNMQRTSNTRKARLEWFLLETIEKVMSMNSLGFAQNIDFCLNSEEQVQKFIKYIENEKYKSYLNDDDLNK